jgi:hypothetical protein
MESPKAAGVFWQNPKNVMNVKMIVKKGFIIMTLIKMSTDVKTLPKVGQ